MRAGIAVYVGPDHTGVPTAQRRLTVGAAAWPLRAKERPVLPMPLHVAFGLPAPWLRAPLVSRPRLASSGRSLGSPKVFL